MSKFDTIKTSIETSLADIKSALAEKEITVTGDLKVSQIANYINQIGISKEAKLTIKVRDGVNWSPGNPDEPEIMPMLTNDLVVYIFKGKKSNSSSDAIKTLRFSSAGQTQEVMIEEPDIYYLKAVPELGVTFAECDYFEINITGFGDYYLEIYPKYNGII